MSGMMNLYGEFTLLVIVIVLLTVIAIVLGRLFSLVRGLFVRWRGGESTSASRSQRNSDWRQG